MVRRIQFCAVPPTAPTSSIEQAAKFMALYRVSFFEKR
jgi:hypothetical protein